MLKAFLYALVLTIEELRNSSRVIKSKATGTLHWVYYMPALIGFVCFCAGYVIGLVYIHASAWGFPLLVPMTRAMRRPFYRGTNDRMVPRFYYVYY